MQLIKFFFSLFDDVCIPKPELLEEREILNHCQNIWL